MLVACHSSLSTSSGDQVWQRQDSNIGRCLIVAAYKPQAQKSPDYAGLLLISFAFLGALKPLDGAFDETRTHTAFATTPSR